MNQTDTRLAAPLAELVGLTATLKSGLAAESGTEGLRETCAAIAAAAEAMTAIGPVEPLPMGLYRAWLDLVLLLGEAKKSGFSGDLLAAVDRAIEAVRRLRRTFGIAPGGA